MVEAPAPPNDSAPLFDSDAIWTMQPEGEGYRLNFFREGSQTPHTVALSDGGTTRVRVHASGERSQAGAADDVTAEPVFSPVRYPLDQLLLMNHLAPRGGVIVHATGLLLGSLALVLPGCSGAGKSTIARLFTEQGLGDSLLSDDRIIITACEGEEPTAWGTPWPGDARVALNRHSPLAGLLFLARAEVNELVRLTPSEGGRRLMPVITSPWYDPGRLPGVLDTCSGLVESIPCYELRFRMDSAAVDAVLSHDWDSEGPGG